VPNPSQKASCDGGKGDACNPDCPGAAQSDEDADGVPDAIDNCAGTYNPDQKNSGGDPALGDACDPDADGDGIPNTLDNCPAMANPDQVDSDHDGKGDACDEAFCYVYDVDSECLDPTSTFAVGGRAAAYGEKAGQGLATDFQTGRAIGLHMFANRKNTPIRYSWVVDQRPDGSGAAIENSWGTVVYSGDTFEYRYHEGAFPTFTPDQPGSYTIKLVGELVFGDDVYTSGPARAQQLMTVTVKGEPTSSGCSVAGSGAGPAALLLLLGLAFLRRRG